MPARLVGLADLDRARAQALAGSLQSAPPVSDVKALAEGSDLVVEAAGAAALAEILPLVVPVRRDLPILSVGGLIGLDEWVRAAAEGGSTIYCPSGAISGLDAVKAAALGAIEEARITTRKPPEGLADAPYLANRSIEVLALDQPRVLFEGSAREACVVFPSNINVSTALSLAGIGVDRTRVRIIADPSIKRNVHEIEVVGEFGRWLHTVTETRRIEEMSKGLFLRKVWAQNPRQLRRHTKRQIAPSVRAPRSSFSDGNTKLSR